MFSPRAHAVLRHVRQQLAWQWDADGFVTAERRRAAVLARVRPRRRLLLCHHRLQLAERQLVSVHDFNGTSADGALLAFGHRITCSRLRLFICCRRREKTETNEAASAFKTKTVKAAMDPKNWIREPAGSDSDPDPLTHGTFFIIKKLS